ncbi:DNA polymerase III subunit gamma/tau [Acinetobacter bouvetii]|uniref:DNA polymerase III subunit gamma/tau n=1 Tax=Acinetobacter bouvetii TaxID=202951 RepID=A0A4Q7AT87_9GAMM|nr:DNA polymerase III subunit gamma/tau [Acinetobacter bouvetii]RZG66612.1 DNA polymerase III subunit gamma/tau [Acinetobacter bouvetii]
MYQVLARKYRPRNFNELVGQNHVSRALTSALDRGRLHHAYLFTGTRGVGKTTIARILAKCLNCETGVTSTPCEVCATCKAVNEGRFIDLIEIDAASRTKVEDTRELLDNVPYAPTQGRFKVYLIDEVHMLSTHSFNALLKTLEEPPEHVKFLFATTDPQKLPITVISRCLQFTLRPLAVDEITSHLTAILEKESISAEQDAIWQIAESAQGSLRDALSLTDQAIAYGQGEVHHQDVKEMLGLIDRTIIYDLIAAIQQNQKERISELLLQFRQQALDVSLVLDQLISTLHELAMLQYLPNLSLKYSAEINAKIMQLSQLVVAQDLQLYYQIACKGRAELQIAVTQEQGFEMCVLRMLAFRPMQSNERLVSAPQAVQQNNAPAVQAPVQNSMQAPVPAALNQTEQLSSHQNVQIEDPLSAASVAPAVSEIDEEYYSDDDEFDGQHHQTASDDPSSDDFLDEPVPPETPAAAAEPQPAADQIVFDAGNGDALFGLEPEQDAKDQRVNAQESSDLLFEAIAPLDDITLHVTDTSAPENAEDVTEQPLQGAEAVTEPHAAALDPELSESSNLMPQDILKLQPQQLEGEWTVDKWEYWFRSSELSPALQELAQHGLMTGEIGGVSTFHVPTQYERLVTQMQHLLEQALHTQWPSTRFDVKYEELEQLTPYALQHERKGKAFQRASELLHHEPVVDSLLAAFDGKLENIQLK